MITGKTESKILTKDISCNCKCKFDRKKCNSNQNWNNKCQWVCKNVYEKGHIWNPATCSCESGKYLANIMDGSVIMFNEIIEEAETILTNFNEKK